MRSLASVAASGKYPPVSPFAEAEQIGVGERAFVLAGKQFAGAAHADGDLIGDQEQIVLRANLAHPLAGEADAAPNRRRHCISGSSTTAAIQFLLRSTASANWAR